MFWRGAERDDDGHESGAVIFGGFSTVVGVNIERSSGGSNDIRGLILRFFVGLSKGIAVIENKV